MDSMGQKGSRDVNVELNLVPFIDLLSTCILFLLVTVVWVEISQMSAFSQASGDTVVQHSDVSSLDRAPETQDLELFVYPDRIDLRRSGRSVERVSFEDISARLTGIQREIGEENTTTTRVSLRAADAVIYENVIRVLDELTTLQFLNVRVGGIE